MNNIDIEAMSLARREKKLFKEDKRFFLKKIRLKTGPKMEWCNAI